MEKHGAQYKFKAKILSNNFVCLGAA